MYVKPYHIFMPIMSDFSGWARFCQWKTYKKNFGSSTGATRWSWKQQFCKSYYEQSIC